MALGFSNKKCFSFVMLGLMDAWEIEKCLISEGIFLFVCLFVSNGCADDTFVILLENGI